MLAISPTAARILEALARYRLLTSKQLVRLGVADLRTVQKTLRELAKTSRLITGQEWRLGPGVGRLDNLYRLSPKGAKLYTEATGEPCNVSRHREIKESTALHRMMTVDALIATDLWAAATGQGRPQHRTYFEGTTRIEAAGVRFEADAIVTMPDSARHRRVYVIEVYRSHSEGRSAHPADQLAAYVVAASAGDGSAFDQAAGVLDEPGSKGARLLVVLETPELRSHVIRALLRRPGLPPADAWVWDSFRFKSADELWQFAEGWQTITGELVSLPV